MILFGPIVECDHLTSRLRNCNDNNIKQTHESSDLLALVILV